MAKASVKTATCTTESMRPMAVASAFSVRKQLVQSGITGLTELQKKIYTAIEQRGAITKHELLQIVDIKPEELEHYFAILRHCELIRTFKEEEFF